MNSCIYEGTVLHRRISPKPHVFRYRMFMMYLDLAELPELFDRFWLWSARRPALAWFRRADYLGDGTVPLDTIVRDEVEQTVGTRPRGPIRVLTHMRYYGYVMNPVTFYYVFNAQDTAVETILAEITNTPWNERHTYVLRAPQDESATQHPFQFPKAFHVSPFMDMDHQYTWRFSEPGVKLATHMENMTRGEKVFDVTLNMERRNISSASLAKALVRYPWMTARVALGIYWQAARLWAKRAPFFVHPSKRTS